MSMLHLTARSHPKVPMWILDDAPAVKLLSQFPSLAFLTVSVTNDDGTPRNGLEATAFSLLVLATPEPVSKQGAKVVLLRAETLDGFYGLVVAPKSGKWPLGEFVFGLQAKVKALRGVDASQGRTVVRVMRD